MAGLSNLNKHGIADFNSNAYNSRRVEAVDLASGDAYLFYVDQCVDGGELVYDISRQVNGASSKAFTSLFSGTMKNGMRVLTGGRRTGNEISNAGLKWVGYKDPNSIGLPYNIVPIIEPYSVSVSYNKNLNIIDLYFWTNLAVADGAQPVYSIENVAVQQENGVFYYDRSTGEKNVYKVLCYAQGIFIKSPVNGTLLDSTDDDYASKTASDYIPIFESPQILHVYKNQDSLISDFSGSEKKFLPFDVRRVFKPESGSVDEKYAIYLPRGFWRRNETKVLRSEITETPINTGSDWFYLDLSAGWQNTSEVPSSNNDFRNLTITQKCEIWAWLSDKGESGDKPWYLAFSSPVYDEAETGTSYVEFHTGTAGTSAQAQAAMDKGLSIHVATAYRSEDDQVFIRQLYHGTKQDYTETGAEGDYLPFDLKTVVVEGQTNPDIHIFIPSTTAWMRNGIRVGSIDVTTITQVGATDWYKLNTVPAGGASQAVWATLVEETLSDPPWYQDIANAKLKIMYPSSDAEIQTSLDYNAAYQIATIAATDLGGGAVSFELQQLYHGYIKDGTETGTVAEILPYDVRVDTTGETPVAQIYLPDNYVWVRNGLPVGAPSLSGWTNISAVLTGTVEIWAVLKENSVHTPPWYQDVTYAQLAIQTSNDTDAMYNAAMKIAEIVVTVGETTTYDVQQLYHGNIKDSWQTGEINVDNDDVTVGASKSIEKYTVEGENEEYIRILGMDETVSTASAWPVSSSLPSDLSILTREDHEIGYLQINSVLEYLGPNGIVKVVVAGGSEEPTAYSANKMLTTNTSSAISFTDPVVIDGGSSSGNNVADEITGISVVDGVLTITKKTKTISESGSIPGSEQTIDAFDLDQMSVGRKYYGTEGTTTNHIPNKVLSVDGTSHVNYMGTEVVKANNQDATNKKASLVKDFRIENNKLVLEVSEVDVTQQAGGASSQEASELDIIQRDNDVPEWGIQSWKKQGDSVKLYMSRLPTIAGQNGAASEESYMPFDLSYREGKIVMMKPVWRRYGVNVPLADYAIGEGGWVILDTFSSGDDIWAILQEEGGSNAVNPYLESNTFIAKAIDPLSFSEWYGTPDELYDSYFITYDGIDFQTDASLHYESLHMEFIRALSLMRGLGYQCENMLPMLDELLTNSDEEVYLGATEILDSFSGYLYSVLNSFNDMISDLDETDNEEDYPLYKFIETESNPLLNAYIYSPVFTKAETIAITGGTITAKDFLKLLIDKAYYLNTLYSLTESEILTGIQTVVNDLAPFATDVQNAIVSKINANLSNLKQEVYDQHLYLLSGSTAHYSEGAWIPENLVKLNNSSFTYDFIDTFKAEIEDYCANPSLEKEQSITEKTEMLLQNDFSFNSLRSLNTYAQYSVPMVLPYYSAFYCVESLTSLYEPRTVKTVLMGDPDDFIVASEKEYVVALLNKLAYCHEWPGNFYSKREAYLSVVSDLAESKTKVLDLMTTIRNTNPTGTYLSVAGAGAGTKTVWSSDEGSTWVKNENTNNVFVAAWRGIYIESTPPAGIAMASPSPRNAIFGDSGAMTAMNGPVIPSKVPIGTNANLTPLSARWSSNGRIVPVDGDTTTLGGSQNGSPYTFLTENEKKRLSDSIEESFWNAGSHTYDELVQSLKDRNTNIDPSEIEAMLQELIDNKDIPEEALAELNDPYRHPTTGNYVNLSYSVKGAINGKWLVKPTNPVYHMTPCTFTVYLKNRLNSSDPNNERYKLQGVYVRGKHLEDGNGDKIVIPAPEVHYLPEGSDEEHAQYEELTYTFSWTIPRRDNPYSGKVTTWGSQKNFQLDAVFVGKKNAKPVYFKTVPTVIYNTNDKFEFATDQDPKYTGRKRLSVPVVYSEPGELLVKKYSSATKPYSGYFFKEWQVNGVTTTPVAKGDYSAFTLMADDVVSAVYEKRFVAVTYSVNNADYGTTTGPSQVEFDQNFQISAVVNSHPDPMMKYVFSKWVCLTEGVTPFSGNAETTSPNPTVTGVAIEALSLQAVFEESHNYDPPSDSDVYRVIVESSGGGSDCAVSVSASESPLNTPCIITTSTDYTSYYDFLEWYCSDADAQITNVNLKSTNFNSAVSKTYVVKALWQSNTTKMLQFTANDVKNDMGTIQLKFTATNLAGVVQSPVTYTLSAPDYTAKFDFDPATMSTVKIEWVLGTTVIAKEDPKTWSYGVDFTPDASFSHNVWLSNDKAFDVSTSFKYMVREGTGAYASATDINLVTAIEKLSVYNGALSQTLTMSATETYYDGATVSKWTPSGVLVGHWKYTFDQWESDSPQGLLYPSTDLHSGYYGVAGVFTSTDVSATVTVETDLAQLFKENSKSLQYIAYYTKEFVETGDIETEDLSEDIDIVYDASVFEIDAPTGFSFISEGLYTGQVQNGAVVEIIAKIKNQSSSALYVWGEDAYWSRNGTDISKTATLTYKAKCDSTIPHESRTNTILTPHASVSEIANVYVKYGPTDAQVAVTITGADGYQFPTGFLTNSVPSQEGYPIKFKIPVGKSFNLTSVASNSSYELDGIYDRDSSATATVSSPILVSSTGDKHYECTYKKIVKDIPVSYSLKVYNETSMQTTDYAGKSCPYGIVEGEDKISEYPNQATLHLKATANSSDANIVEFVNHLITETWENGTTHQTTSTNEVYSLVLNASTVSVAVETQFNCQNDTTPPSYPNRTLNVGVSPSSKGEVAITLTPSSGNPVTGSINYLGNNFTVLHNTGLVAVPSSRDSQYRFKQWEATIAGIKSTVTGDYSGNITGDTNLVAVFEQTSQDTDSVNPNNPPDPTNDDDPDPSSETDNKVYLTLVPTPSDGAETYSPRDPTAYTKNTKVKISVTPAKGYKFDSWGDGDKVGNGSTSTVEREFLVTETMSLGINLSYENEMQPPLDYGVTDSTGTYPEEVIPWYAPRNTTVLKIVKNPSDEVLQTAMANAAALHIGKVIIKGVYPDSTFTVSQYYHGERVDYIDYGDADCDWQGSQTSFKSIIFNDGEGADSNRKPARIYGFDASSTSDYPSHEAGSTDTEWQKYGILARKATNSSDLSQGAELVYLKIPETPEIPEIPDGTNNRDVLYWDDKKSSSDDGQGNITYTGGWDVTAPIGKIEDESLSEAIGAAGEYPIVTDVDVPEDSSSPYLLEKTVQNMTLEEKVIVTSIAKNGTTVTASKEKILAVKFTDQPENPESDTFEITGEGESPDIVIANQDDGSSGETITYVESIEASANNQGHNLTVHKKTATITFPTPVTMTVITGASWDAETGSLVFTRASVQIISQTPVEDQTIAFYQFNQA